MARFTTALAVQLLAAAAAVAQPKIIEIGPTGAARPVPEAVLRLREEVELTEAQLETKKAYVKAAEVVAVAAEREFTLLTQAGRAVDAPTLERAKAAVEAARAQLDVRKAEANEVAVKLKHARRRADVAAVGGVWRPIAAVPGIEVGRDVQLQLLTGVADIAAAQETAARAQADRAKAKLGAAKRAFDVGAGTKEEYEAAAADAAVAEANVKQAAAVAAALRAAQETIKPPGGAAPDRKQLEAAADRAEAALKLKQAEVEKAKAVVTKAKAELERLKELAARGIVPQSEFDAARATVAEAEANVKVAEAELTIAEAALKRAKQAIGH